MASHPNFEKQQAYWDAVRNGDWTRGAEVMAENIVIENGPGAGPWHRANGRDEAFELLLDFAGALNYTFAQDGRCIYADDRVAIALVHETATAENGDRFDNLAVYVNRLGPDGAADRLWTVDLDTEHCEEFWRNNPAKPSKDFS